MKKGTIATLLILLTLTTVLWLFRLPLHSFADGPVVKVTQVDPSQFPLVTLYVSVTDDAGQPVAALTQEDFSLSKNDEAVEIVDFAGIGEARQADIIFVFDTTTSMVEEVEGMRATSLAFADKLRERRIDYRLGLVDFGDVINRVEKEDGQLTDDAAEFKSWINEMQLAGGGFEIPELTLGALQRASDMTFRKDVLKILILIVTIQAV